MGENYRYKLDKGSVVIISEPTAKKAKLRNYKDFIMFVVTNGNDQISDMEYEMANIGTCVLIAHEGDEILYIVSEA
ncbi:Hypothetical predicted protein [Octopus vulgaris]|uniref:Uncharacterized protein n=1 Tax=Octopus vulgaris TaxID=6645 RepID=A0AA36F827_OCTVU|nr:Hypothetical predicted protein [Octopus vulgaris]